MEQNYALFWDWYLRKNSTPFDYSLLSEDYQRTYKSLETILEKWRDKLQKGVVALTQEESAEYHNDVNDLLTDAMQAFPLVCTEAVADSVFGFKPLPNGVNPKTALDGCWVIMLLRRLTFTNRCQINPNYIPAWVDFSNKYKYVILKV